MSRPNVFPKSSDNNLSLDEQRKEYEEKKTIVANQIYNDNIEVSDDKMSQALDEMRKRSLYQMELKKQNNQISYDLLEVKEVDNVVIEQKEQVKPQVKTQVISDIDLISQPDFNSAFDIIPLPSRGLQYKNRRPSVKVSYMNTSDEVILTSPKLLESGKFLEVLINKKLLETDLRYQDLLVGDRNAIMVWLRGNAFGTDYNAVFFDEDNNPFESTVDLSSIELKYLELEPDENGNFEYVLPLSKSVVKFKYLTISETEEILEKIEKDVDNGILTDNSVIYTLEKKIVSIDGETNKLEILDRINKMSIKDSRALRTFMDMNEPNVDTKITVKTPRGGSIVTFLPINTQFFWPDIQL